jgi:hypothetical protein
MIGIGRLALVRGVPGHSRDIRAADPDVGKLPIAQAAELAQALIVAFPLADEADDGSKHDVPLSLVPAIGRLSRVTSKIGLFAGLKTNNGALQQCEKRIS